MMMVQTMVTMPRFSSIRPVNRVKHVIDSSGTVSGTTVSANTLAMTVDVRGTPFSPVEVVVGSKINGFFLSVFMIGSTGAPQANSQNWFLIKVHTGQNAAVPVPGNTGVSEIRNQIIHEEKGVTGSGDGTPMVFKGVVAIPRGMRRMRSGDLWSLNLVNTDAGDNSTFCVKAIYNEFF